MINLYAPLTLDDINEMNAAALEFELSDAELILIARFTSRNLYTVRRWFGQVPEKLRLVTVDNVGRTLLEALTTMNLNRGVRLILGVLLHSGISADVFTSGRYEQGGTLETFVEHYSLLVYQMKDDFLRMQLREFSTEQIAEGWEWTLIYSYPSDEEYDLYKNGGKPVPVVGAEAYPDVP